MEFSVIVGWFGVVAYTVGYGCLSLGWLSAGKNGYHILNAIGGICLVVNAYNLADTPAIVVNLVWFFIAATSILRISVQKKSR